jgi:hypothetical protein
LRGQVLAGGCVGVGQYLEILDDPTLDVSGGEPRKFPDLDAAGRHEERVTAPAADIDHGHRSVGRGGKE